METRNPDDIKWCSDCGRYYNPKVDHECITKGLNEGRDKLEKFLGKFKIKEND